MPAGILDLDGVPPAFSPVQLRKECEADTSISNSGIWDKNGNSKLASCRRRLGVRHRAEA